MRRDFQVALYDPNIAVLSALGRITLGEGASELRDKLRELLGKGYTRVALVLEETEYMDSSGLGELVSFWTTARNSGGILVIVQPPKKIKDIFQITKLYTVFDVFDSVEDALRYLRAYKPPASDHVQTS